MTRLDPAHGRQRERLVGGIVVLVGVAVLVLSIVALVGAASGADSDVAGPAVTLPAGSGSASPTGSASSSPSATGSAGATSSPTSSATGSASATGAGARQPLVVLNNTRTTGLAQQAAATFTQGGWTVTDTANISEDILSTCAYYDPGVAGAQAAAQALMDQFPVIKRIKEKFGALPDGPVVVVLTADYTAQ